MQYTPGPWEAYQYETRNLANPCWLIQAQGRTIARIERESATEQKTQVEDAANARLIALAPAMKLSDAPSVQALLCSSI